MFSYWDSKWDKIGWIYNKQEVKVNNGKEIVYIKFNGIEFYPTWGFPIIFYGPIVENYQAMNIWQMEYKCEENDSQSMVVDNIQLSTQTNSENNKTITPVDTKKSKNKKLVNSGCKKSTNLKQKDLNLKQIEKEKVISKRRKSKSKLNFDTEWRNENRNIIPNIMNQMLSFVEKRHKSQRLISKLFEKHTHEENWTIPKFYCYMKRMKSSMGHYITQNQLQAVTKIHEPYCEIYPKQEQLFYLKICRIAFNYFFKTESVLISLTSNRMSEDKRMAHLVARRVLFTRMEQILQQIIN